jgi:aerobic carbon-monoxide dehydrogenase small subunit
MVLISTTVDGADHADEVKPRLLLVHYLRTRLGRTGTVIGCDTSNCGACTVQLDGLSVKSCTLLAVQADAAVRLLHGRHDHVRGRPADGESRSVRAGGA